MTLRIIVARAPVSVNATYKRGKGKRLFLSEAARDFKEALRAQALVARMKSAWPHPDKVRGVSLSIVTWNTKHDADAPCKIVADSLEGIVYANDKVVRSVHASKDADFSRKRRVEITVELLEVA